LSKYKSKNKFETKNEKNTIKKYWRNFVLLILLKMQRNDKSKIIKKINIKNKLIFLKILKVSIK